MSICHVYFAQLSRTQFRKHLVLETALFLQSSLDHNSKHYHLKAAVTAQTLALATAHVIHSVDSRKKPHGPSNLVSLCIITFAQLLVTV